MCVRPREVCTINARERLEVGLQQTGKNPSSSRHEVDVVHLKNSVATKRTIEEREVLRRQPPAAENKLRTGMANV